MKDYGACFEFAQQAIVRNSSYNTTLFTNRDIVEWLAPYESCVCGLELQKGESHAAGHVVCKDLASRLHENIAIASDWQLDILEFVEEALQLREGMLQ